MQRLAIASTALLTLIGAVVVAAYLFIFAAGPDRIAQAVPSGAALYATVHLEPGPGQRMNLAALLGRVPGFADQANLDTKIHQITARLLGQAAIDYEANLRPWLGDRASVAVPLEPTASEALVLLEVREPDEAASALPRLIGDLGYSTTTETHEGVELTIAEDGSTAALLEDLLILGESPDAVRRALDADAGRSSSLGDDARFNAAMARVPADNLAAIYVDFDALSGEDGDALVSGFSTASLALVAEQEGLHLVGGAPFDADAASEESRAAFELGGEVGSMGEWMPQDTEAGITLFGLAQLFSSLEGQLGDATGTGEIADAVNQIRALAALGLGIDLNEDVLPLFDREAGLAVSGLGSAAPQPLLLLRPSDPAAAQAALGRMRDALADRGASVQEDEAEGTTITSVEVPQLGEVSYAVVEDTILLGMGTDAITAALQARAGSSLSEQPAYTAAWELAGTRGGNEAYLDGDAALDAFGEELGVSGELGDILREIEAVAMTAPSRNGQIEIHVVVTVR